MFLVLDFHGIIAALGLYFISVSYLHNIVEQVHTIFLAHLPMAPVAIPNPVACGAPWVPTCGSFERPRRFFSFTTLIHGFVCQNQTCPPTMVDSFCVTRCRG